MPVWRQASAGDIPGLLQVSDVVHPSLPESDSVYKERVQLFPGGCLVLVDLEKNKVCGYAISHPVLQSRPPALDSLLGQIAHDADQYYIHDVAILPEFRGQGLAAECIERLLEVGNQYSSTCLVSVYGTQHFWARFGFVSGAVDEVMVEKLRGYGKDAVYLTRENFVR
ncbi:uncharacterized protein PgNI_01908 [Pyricularia grisea]|uniref:N-acetyltransferase domain-containing protein n=1 Tax=Pyricularia grisea TaxID=148305 RepID=A0A6P8BHB0_PYRGI|nr:uncharacterized protein PgNI_01908 [Pyricularia grisea]TLD15999.1 hypothetical protein PgNI_01908 [Pyricularia grisea]